MGYYIICPFCKYEQKLDIGCEDRRIRFNNNNSKSDYIKKYCGSREYLKCTLAAEISRKYNKGA